MNVVLLLLAGICGQAACAGGPATRPDGLGRTYAGEWMGTTSEGTAIAFDVSDANIVTRIALDRNEAITMRTRDYVGRIVRTRTASFAAAATSSNGRKQRDQIDRRPIQSTSVCASRCVGTANRNCVRTVSHPPKPWVNTMIYGETPIHIAVAGSR